MKKSFLQKASPLALAVAFASGCVPLQPFSQMFVRNVSAATAVPYISRNWDGSKVVTVTNTADCKHYIRTHICDCYKLAKKAIYKVWFDIARKHFQTKPYFFNTCKGFCYPLTVL